MIRVKSVLKMDNPIVIALLFLGFFVAGFVFAVFIFTSDK